MAVLYSMRLVACNASVLSRPCLPSMFVRCSYHIRTSAEESRVVKAALLFMFSGAAACSLMLGVQLHEAGFLARIGRLSSNTQRGPLTL
jgi:hypothetical protein